MLGFNSEKSDKKVILAVDDQPEILDTLQKLLRLEYKVYGLTSADEAMRFLKKNTPDLILLDIEMPEVDGLALLGALRDMEKLKNIPIVFLTAASSVENLEYVAQGGADGFIPKPIDFKFGERIKTFLK